MGGGYHPQASPDHAGKLLSGTIAAIAVIVFLIAFIRTFQRKSSPTRPVAKRFMTPRELAMLGILERLLPEYRFHAQVAMSVLRKAPEPPTEDDAKLADNLRALAFRIVSGHQVAAAYLTLAAACIAPTSKTDLNIAKHVWDDILHFSNELSSLACKVRLAREFHGRLTTDGIRVSGLEKSWAYIFDGQAPR